ncbi:NAD(P)-binding domain-containing protein [Streptomyces sp. RTGN2]|uniref:lactate/malate family dehydrogenase n=1 Tax=Streptomyces sp. RTGN2 TaxID=3016525 RepID=UPI002554A051|nr:NAD(P)-binding domain-containing protein [Streptomyces sp. RTGN2]
MKSIGVIGAGAVGQALAPLLVTSGWCHSVLLASGSGRTAAGLVTDLEDMRQVTSSSVRVALAEPALMRSCDAVVVCPRAVFTNTARTDVRMAGLAANVPLVAALARQLHDYRGVVVMVTNPVDVLSRLFAEVSGCRQVYGVGSNTDTARYHLVLSRLLAVPVTAVAGHVIGEHGDHAVICASSTTVHGRPAAVPLQHVRAELAARPGRINAGIGRTRCGPAGATLAALEHALGVSDGVIELSTRWPGGWAGIPLRFAAGRSTVCLPPLNPAEARALDAADTKIRTAYDRVHLELTQETTPS